MNTMAHSFVTIFTLCLLPHGTPLTNPPQPQDPISTVFTAYAVAEEHQDYVVVYGLLSSRLRKRLLDEQRVENAADYRHLRESSEARWYDLHESSPRAAGADRATIKFRATIEENGERETVIGTLRLVLERRHWKIDLIDYRATK
jgi:hypothetical protein